MDMVYSPKKVPLVGSTVRYRDEFYIIVENDEYLMAGVFLIENGKGKRYGVDGREIELVGLQPVISDEGKLLLDIVGDLVGLRSKQGNGRK